MFTTYSACPASLKQRRRKLAIILLLVPFLLLHFVIIPDATRMYHQPCYLTEEQLTDMRYMVRNIIAVYEEMNVTYWLDHGTLLGAHRIGDIMRHDGDADMGIIYPEGAGYTESKFLLKLKERGITGTARVAEYKGFKTDIQQWISFDGEFEGKPCKMLKKYKSVKKIKTIRAY